ncbi:carboxylesterase 4A-like [Penaeus japonicus]|uniref:carboxylesterase 4A-like n=1 Tax=Penaeus japonicus TaxID=27405 RepID=UPI001C7132F2|nr:carboxylesterase 4A-like [Penaeus japonicus]XP_042890035.1 carboxylesterase 4A-like [Penaeus japonicus]
MIAVALLLAAALQSTVEGGVVQWQYYGNSPEVTLRQGRLQGRRYQAYKGTIYHSYVGIPYAQPPVGSLRFQDPVAASGWEGVKEALRYPKGCPQMDRTEVVGSEDCLYLSVHAPEAESADGGHPVMVYIHGGDYLAGRLDDYPPLPLLNHEVVLVVLQYRLGVLGFLSTEDSSLPGNLGLKDQTLALRWVQENIRDFGGDPGKVTVFGQGSGAHAVHFQILTPYSRGLFSRAILQSGSALCPKFSRGGHLDVAKEVAWQVGCLDRQGSQEPFNSTAFRECLRDVQVEKLVRAYIPLQVWNGFPYTMAPRVDGDYLPAEPAVLLSSGNFSKVDLVLGMARNEGALMTATMFYDWSPVRQLQTNFPLTGTVSLSFEREMESGHLAGVSYFYYIGDNEINIKEVANLTQLYTDRYISVCTDQTAILHAQHGSSVYMYELEHRALASSTDKFQHFFDNEWVSHGDDLQYLFSGSNGFPNLRTFDDLLTGDMITTLWTNFAKTGKPTPDGSLGFEWRPVTNATLVHLALSPAPEMREDGRAQLRIFWNSLPTRQNKILFLEDVGYFAPGDAEDDEQEDRPSEGTKDTDSEADVEDSLTTDVDTQETTEVIEASATQIVVGDLRDERIPGASAGVGIVGDPSEAEGTEEDSRMEVAAVDKKTETAIDLSGGLADDDNLDAIVITDDHLAIEPIPDGDLGGDLEDKVEGNDLEAEGFDDGDKDDVIGLLNSGHAKDSFDEYHIKRFHNKHAVKASLKKKYSQDDILIKYSVESAKSEVNTKYTKSKHKASEGSEKLNVKDEGISDEDLQEEGHTGADGEPESSNTHGQAEDTDIHTQEEYTDTHTEAESTDTRTQAEYTDIHTQEEYTDTHTQEEYTDTHTQEEYTDTHTGAEYTGTDAERDYRIQPEDALTETQTAYVDTPSEDSSSQQKAPGGEFFIVKKMIDYGDIYKILKENEEAIRQYNAAMRLAPSMCTVGEEC